VGAPQKVKDLALRMLGMETDTAIYDRTRLWRSPNTINGKGNLYKIPLTHDELMNLPLDQIKKLACRPRTVAYAAPEPIPALVDLKDASRVILRDDVPKVTNEQTADVVAVIQEFMPPVGERHLFARALAGYLLPRLKKPRTLSAMLDAWDGSDADTLRDVEQHVEDTAEKWMNDEPFEGGPKLDERVPGIVSVLSANSTNGANRFSHGQIETRARADIGSCSATASL
jgi:hypothetical protein